LDAWYRIAQRAQWQSLLGVRSAFPGAAAVWKFTGCNSQGNAYRFITEINERTGRMFLRQDNPRRVHKGRLEETSSRTVTPECGRRLTGISPQVIHSARKNESYTPAL
jgi:HigB_toxin, RelE-like toxic component of a toxin-antitoxin system